MAILRNRAWACVLPGILTGIFLFGLATTASAQDSKCVECHKDVAFASPAHPQTKCTECHTNVTQTPHDALPPEQKLEGNAICAQCHGMAAKQLVKSVHAEHTCKTCHGPGHSIDVATNQDARMSALGQVKTCGKCHSEVIDGFKNSVHGEGLLKSGLTQAAPSCSSCHGTHSIQKHDAASAKTGHLKSPETCGACHATVLKQWEEESAHGLAWKESRNGPVCVDCHVDEHGVKDPTSAAMRMHMPSDCGGCHKEGIETYRDSFHGKATELGWTSVAMCSDCHTPHQSLPASDPRSSVNPANLAATCGKCHDGEVQHAGFLTFSPHVDPHSAKTLPQLRYIYLFMTGLLLGVFGFFFIHLFLWLQRGLVGKLRGEFKTWTRRVRPLCATFQPRPDLDACLDRDQLPAAVDHGPAAEIRGRPLGEVNDRPAGRSACCRPAASHRCDHHVRLLRGAPCKSRLPDVREGATRVPVGLAFDGAAAARRHRLHREHEVLRVPWAAAEIRPVHVLGEFDYLAVFWGVAMIGLSGLMLWFPGFFSRLVPGWVLNAAYIIHSDEALLATGFIFLFHFFHTHLRPEAFPMDPVIFTGSMPLERFKEERPLEYERLVANGHSIECWCPPPSSRT